MPLWTQEQESSFFRKLGLLLLPGVFVFIPVSGVLRAKTKVLLHFPEYLVE